MGREDTNVFAKVVDSARIPFGKGRLRGGMNRTRRKGEGEELVDNGQTIAEAVSKERGWKAHEDGEDFFGEPIDGRDGKLKTRSIGITTGSVFGLDTLFETSCDSAFPFREVGCFE